MARHSDDSTAKSGEQSERITIVFLALSWAFIMLRIFTRTYIMSNFGWDDSTMILAGVRPKHAFITTIGMLISTKLIFTVYCAALLYIGSNGGGTHISDLSHLQLLTKVIHPYILILTY